MSEINIISSEYDALVSITDKVNNAIIAYKKGFVLASGDEIYKNVKFYDGEQGIAKKDLTAFIINVFQFKDRDYIPDYKLVPKKTVEVLRKIIIDDSINYNKLKKVQKRIEADRNLDKEQLDLLDTIVSTLDSERSMLFRKLRTARG